MTCVVCGVVFYRKFGSRNPERVFCSKACYGRAIQLTPEKRIEAQRKKVDYKRFWLSCAGQTINFNTMPPEVQEVARLLRDARAAVRNVSVREKTA